MLRMLKTILTRPSLAIGVFIVSVFIVMAAAAPLLAPPADKENPYLMHREGFRLMPEPPGPEHLLGKLPQQFDIYYGLVWGTRTALKYGLLVAMGRLVIGSVLGLISGYYGKWVDGIIMRITDAFLAFPIIAAVMLGLSFFAITAQTYPGGGRLIQRSNDEQVIIMTLILFGWMSYARLVRGNVLVEREKDYMQAAVANGAGSVRIMFRHLLHNITQGLFVLVASDIGAVVVLLSAFSFIGLIPPGHSNFQMAADWGKMLVASRDWIIGSSGSPFENWYTYMPVSLAIILFSMGWNLIGDGLQKIMNPHGSTTLLKKKDTSSGMNII